MVAESHGSLYSLVGWSDVKKCERDNKAPLWHLHESFFDASFRTVRLESMAGYHAPFTELLSRVVSAS